jgi:hypothetical protein
MPNRSCEAKYTTITNNVSIEKLVVVIEKLFMSFVCTISQLS